MDTAASGTASPTEPPLPLLRPDLKLLPGPEGGDGQPTWTLHDPLRNRFFRLGWLERLLLVHWHSRTVEALRAAVLRASGFRVTAEQVEGMRRFLADNTLVQAVDGAAAGRLVQRFQARRKTLWQWFLSHYLFFWIPLARPDRFLRATYPHVRFVYSRWFRLSVLVAGLAGLHLTIRHWDLFQTTFVHFLSLEGVLWYGTTLVAVKVLHELGHAYTAHRYGCRVPSMGVAFMVLWPVLYTDASDAWRLTDRRARLAIAAAGVGVELLLAALATFLWLFLPTGPAQSSAVLLATVTWVTSLAINLNPCMRFDGYYLLSDLLGMDNLQERSFALGKWRLREWLFGLGALPPERFSPRRRRILLVYAYVTWIYRLFVFVGIALLVYHLLFKLAGIILMAVELVWFLGRPVWREGRQWWRGRGRMRWNRQSWRTLLLLTALIAFLALPWPGTVEAPAVLTARQRTRIFAPEPARVVRLLVHSDQTVAAGEPLLTLEAPELEQRLWQVRQRIAALQWEIDHASARTSVLENSPVLQQELVVLLTERAGLEEKIARLRVTAPFSGRVEILEKGLAPGRWVDAGTALMVLLDPLDLLVEAFLPEQDVGRIRDGAAGRFVPAVAGMDGIPVHLSTIDPTATRFLDRPELASRHGGSLPVWRDDQGRLVPVHAVYRLLFEPVAKGLTIPRVLPGTVAVNAGRRSLLSRFGTLVAGVAIRESGF